MLVFSRSLTRYGGITSRMTSFTKLPGSMLPSIGDQQPKSSPASSAPFSSTSSEYQRRDAHKTHTDVKDEEHYVLTLHLDDEMDSAVSALRAKYFPAERLKVAAHICLFRALPGSLLAEIRDDIFEEARHMSSFTIRTGEPFRMGNNGVGLSVSGLGPVEGVTRHLQKKWCKVLSQQDRGRFRGHFTIMNKVHDKEIVEKCLQEVRDEFPSCEGTVQAFCLWRYDHGYWKDAELFRFSHQFHHMDVHQ
ncbi:hypothetical protein QBC46DRAFT_391063 [Diplogelasinospora grovesii]|uniref:Uncharacterized protein n=1 Tax=Diplogelasinospora grovesii TaxID=303347 RepID=A0AAN6S338_9PEZI|nr:hypothetical protein QBC46DRAFT_391063 [Diplogelasinospora grovesii]